MGNRKSELLGMPISTAGYRLARLILLDMARKLQLDNCYRCGEKIESVETLSIEHKESWMLSATPYETYFDLSNIIFSHVLCNSRASATAKKKDFCNKGHPMVEGNLYYHKKGTRHCLTCKNEYNRLRKQKPEYKEYRRQQYLRTGK
jgi:hypothetical protein